MSISSPTVTINDWQAKLIERAAAGLAHFAKTTAADKLKWCPQLDGAAQTRHIFDQIHECAVVNRRFATLLGGDDPGPFPQGGSNYANIDEATHDLLESAAALATAIRTSDADVWQRTFTTPRGDMPGAVIMELPMANMHYHAGVVNYIQMLAGDEEFHVPEGFMDFTF